MSTLLAVVQKVGAANDPPGPFLGRSYSEPSELVRRMVREQFGDLGRRFHQALSRAAPNVPPDEMWWRLMAVVAVVTSMLATEGGAPTSWTPTTWT